jgi:cytidine deaminase
MESWETEGVAAALSARDTAYAPYSQFKVGAALYTDSDKWYTGANIENAAFGATICAERVAACAAWSDGNRKWLGMTIAAPGEIVPCGICLQFLVELAPDLLLILVNAETQNVRALSLKELLPHPFDGRP